MSENALEAPVAEPPHLGGALRWLHDFQDALCEINELNSRHLAKLRLTTTAYHALSTVWVSGPDGITVSALAQRLRLGSSTTTELVSRMERQGWMVRRTNQADRRSSFLELTQSGRCVVQAACSAHLVHLVKLRSQVLGLLKALELDLSQIAKPNEE